MTIAHGLLALAGLTGILLVGAWLRGMNLQTLPKLTDETYELLWSLRIARGEHLPLTNYDAYDGALFNYLMAAVFRLVGPDLQAPRLLMLLIGLATLALTFLCVREARGATAGLLAAAMLAVSPVHVVVNSRVAWGNCLTPLLTTAAFWLVYRLIGAPKGGGRANGKIGADWLLGPVGLLFGLALQTHPSVFALFPGVALTLALERPRLLLSRWLLLGVGGFALGYANMLVFNLAYGFESIQSAQQTRAAYTGAAPEFGREYLGSLQTLLMGLYRMVGGAIEDRDSWPAYLGDPTIWLTGLVALTGVVWAAWRGDRLPLLVTLCAAIFLPLVNDRYEPILDGRYLVPLLPLIYGATAGLLVDLWRRGASPQRRSVVPRAASVLGCLVMLLIPLLGLGRYTQQHTPAALRSARLWATVALAEASVPSGSLVVLDRDLGRFGLGAGSTELSAFEYAFTARGVPYRVVRVTPGGLAARMAGEGPRLVLMERNKRKLLDPRVRARPVDASLSGGDAQPSAYGVYLVRWEPDR